MNSIFKSLLVIGIFTFFSCGQKIDKVSSKRPQKNQVDFFSVNYELRPYTINEFIEFEFNNLDPKNNIDSIEVFSGNHLFRTLYILKQKIPTNTLLLGQNIYSFKVHFSDQSKQVKSRSIAIWGIKPPTKLNYKIVNTYNHDRGAYTQGLQFNNGYLYEGTGQFGKSNIRKVDLTTGKVIQQENIPSHQFGEGITIVEDKIYQLTWKSTRGYIYDLTSLKKIQSFHYPQNLEGWGLTFDGKQLIMSDGSDRLFFWNTPELTSHHFIKVSDNKKTYSNINELEYINGFIYANIYLENQIIKINPNTGLVVATIDFANLLSTKDKMSLNNPSGEVLNGIAYNKEKQTFYVTGKDWPKLFELKIF